MLVKNSGFTLIELVLVIVILGILSASAAPKFMNLATDARIASLHGLKAAMTSARNMVHSKAIIAGLDKAGYEEKYICLNGSAKASCDSSNGIEIRVGYPTATPNGILAALDIDAVAYNSSDVNKHEWQYRTYDWNNATGDKQFFIGPVGIPLPEKYEDNNIQSGCYIFYDSPSGNQYINTAKGRIIMITNGC